jgi:Fe-S cluster assembly protein SufD
MTDTLDTFVAEAERVAADRRNDPSWLTRVRSDALDRFQTLGFPTLHDEEWRFTSVAPIAGGRFTLARNGASSVAPADVIPFLWPGTRAATLVFVNGRYAPAISDTDRLPGSVHFANLGDEGRSVQRQTDLGAVLEAHLTRAATDQQHPFTALNTAFLSDGAFIYVPESTVVENPIHVLFLSVAPPDLKVGPTAAGPALLMAHPRVLVVMGANSQASVVESYGHLRGNQYFTNAVTEIVAGANATLNHYRVQRESPESFHVGGVYVRAGRDAHVASHSISLGGALVRNDVSVVLDGEGGTGTLTGLYLGDGTRLVDNHTTIDHARPHCSSREVYKGILADHARAVFNGKIVVRPDAQKTDAKQTNKALLLSEDAHINTKPQLEIFANDVKCTHGAAVGQMDDEAVFYLRARGLGEPEARAILIRAFAGDVLNQMPLEPLRACMDEELVRRLPECRR